MLFYNLPKFASVLLSEVLLRSVLYQIWQLRQLHGQEPEKQIIPVLIRKCSTLKKKASAAIFW
jgi:hypothetical protein